MTCCLTRVRQRSWLLGMVTSLLLAVATPAASQTASQTPLQTASQTPSQTPAESSARQGEPAGRPGAPSDAHRAAAVAAAETQDLVRGAERPWAQGVPEQKQQAALMRFREGNALLKESLFRPAVEKYRLALAEWDHPGIHYNLALAMLNLDQTLEVYEHLGAAIKHGPDPLDTDKFEHAKSYLKLVEKQLAPVDIQCNVVGAEVKLDGRMLFRAPGRYQGMLRPGTHTVVASKEGYSPTERTRVLLPAEPSTFSLPLYRPDELIEYRRRWPVWGPIVATAAGVAMLSTALVLTTEAKNKFSEFDRGFQGRCVDTACSPSSSQSDLKNQGDTFQTGAGILYAVGGVTLAGGIALWVLNGSVPYRIEPNERRTSPSAVSVLPFFGAQSAGFVGATRF